MTNLRRTITRSVTAIAVAATGLAIAPSEARAEVITFTVHEDPALIPGVNLATFSADDITGKYFEQLTLDTVTGTFSASLYVDFSDYVLGGTTVTSQVGALGGEVANPNEYGLYALVTAGGTFSTLASTCPGPTPCTIYQFSPLTSTANIYVDPLQDTTKTLPATGGLPVTTANTVDDLQVMTASLLDTFNSFGSVTVRNSDSRVLSGSYALVYTNPTLVGIGPLYWTGLSVLGLTATASGDVDPGAGSNFATGAIRGDTDLFFEGQRVPEPASLTLLGMGLLGAGFVARRRRTKA